MMRIDVYQGDTLAAVFASGRGPVYYGAAGADVRRRVTAEHVTYNPYSGELLLGGLWFNGDDWLVSSVADGLAGSGYRLDVHGGPKPFSGGDRLTVF